MEDNPFSALVGIMRNEAEGAAPAAWRIGKVASDSPLSIEVGGAAQDSGSLVAAYAPSRVAVSVDESESHSHAAEGEAEAPRYRRGDMVLLLPIEEEQRYIILAKLVGL